MIIRFRQIDGVKDELLEPAVIDVEELDGVASVTWVSPLFSVGSVAEVLVDNVVGG